MDSALRLLSEWSMRAWSDVSVMKIKKVSARKSPILLVIPLAAAAPAAYGQATPLGAPTQAGRGARPGRRRTGPPPGRTEAGGAPALPRAGRSHGRHAIRATSLSPRIGGKL